MEVAKELGADYVIDVQKEDPLARIMEITGGKGVDVVLDCTAGAGTIPILLGIEALKRKAGTMVVQGEMAEFPNFPLGEVHGEIHHHQERARPQLQGVRTRAGAARVEALSAGEGHHPPLRAEGCRPRHQVGRRPGRAGRDPRLADAVAIDWTAAR